MLCCQDTKLALDRDRGTPGEAQHHTAPAAEPAPGGDPGAPPRLARGGEEENSPPARGGVARAARRGGGSLSEEEWHAKRDGVVRCRLFPWRPAIVAEGKLGVLAAISWFSLGEVTA